MSTHGKSLLDQPTHDALTRVIRNCLRAAARGLADCEKSVDTWELHAFRVAIRRLWSLMRAYGPWLGRVAGRKVVRRLEGLTLATNAARDAEVGIHWLLAQRDQLARDERAGFNVLLRRLEGRRRRAYKSIGRSLGRDFSATARLIGHRIRDTREPELQPFRATILDRLEPAVTKFREQVAAIAGADDEKNIHKSRIRVKRLRYLVEPLCNDCAEARALVRPLKRMQMLLGDLHDMQVLEEEIVDAIEETATAKARRLHRLAVDGPAAALRRERSRDECLGLFVLASRARERRNQTFAVFERAWLTHRRFELGNEVRALRAAVGR